MFLLTVHMRKNLCLLAMFSPKMYEKVRLPMCYISQSNPRAYSQFRLQRTLPCYIIFWHCNRISFLLLWVLWGISCVFKEAKEKKIWMTFRRSSLLTCMIWLTCGLFCAMPLRNCLLFAFVSTKAVFMVYILWIALFHNPDHSMRRYIAENLCWHTQLDRRAS